MGAVSRILLAVWLFIILGFCVYGFLVTYPMPRGILLSLDVHGDDCPVRPVHHSGSRTNASASLIETGIGRSTNSADRSRDGWSTRRAVSQSATGQLDDSGSSG